ncbi:MAG TPA: hypothetical protein VL984_14420 [Acidimicrobiales bacterium]|nr:hypothetical protein [Acidimicrobiales bacterium]
MRIVNTPRRAAIAGAALLVAASGAQVAATGTAGAQGVTLSATPSPLGVNTAAWDGYFNDAAVPPALSAAHLGLVRYPGGSWADQYFWQTNTEDGNVQPVSFAQFSSDVDAANGQKFVTVNYGSGTPADAGAWATQSLTSGEAVALWEIGNEEYGSWETDDHPNPHTAASYASNGLAYMQAIKAAVPGAQVCYDYAMDPSLAPGSGISGYQAWNDTVLKADAADINCADVHWYPFSGTPTETSDQILATITKIPAAYSEVHAALSAYDPNAYFVVGELNISSSETAYNSEPVAALFSAATVLQWLAYGAKSVDWWDAHNYGTASADFGLLSSGGTGEGPVDTPLAPYYGYVMASKLAQPGATLSLLSGLPSNTYGWSSTADNGSVLLVNASSSGTAKVSCSAISKSGTVTEYTYDSAATSVVQSQATCSKSLTLPVESVVVVSEG